VPENQACNQPLDSFAVIDREFLHFLEDAALERFVLDDVSGSRSSGVSPRFFAHAKDPAQERPAIVDRATAAVGDYIGTGGAPGSRTLHMLSEHSMYQCPSDVSLMFACAPQNGHGVNSSFDFF
jgi:hypothetical protein